MPDPSRPSQSDSGKRLAITPKEVIAFVLVGLAVVFVVENTKSTRIRFIVPQVNTPLAVALGAAVVIGFIAGLLVSRRRQR